MSDDRMIIQMKGLTKAYGEKKAVDNLTLGIKRGEVFGLLGPNGAGKTTTTLMLLGLTAYRRKRVYRRQKLYQRPACRKENCGISA